MRRPWRGSLGLALMSLSTSVALSRLITHGLRPGVIVPMVVAIVVADRGTDLIMRFGVPMVPAIVTGAVLGLVALLIGLDPTLINPVSARFADGSLYARQLHAAQSALAHDGTPLPALVGVKVAIGALGGLAAAATRSIWKSQHRREQNHRGHVGPLTGCIAPSFGVFVYSTLVSANHGRVPAAVAYFAGVALFVALVDRAGVDLTRSSAGRLPAGSLVGTALVALVVLLAGSGLAGMRLSVFHITPPTGGSNSALLTGTALVDNLRAVEVNESNTVIFHATSSVPTYWQIGTLNTFNGTEWLPTAGTDAALAGSSSATAASLGPAALPVPTNGQTFTSSLRLSDLASRLLPAPPDALTVSGLSGTTSVGPEGVLAQSVSTVGTAYSVTAQLPPTTPTSSTQLALNDPRLAPYLALPKEPIVVTFLAHEAVGSATTQGAQAQALVDWFRSDRFRYTLDPPASTGSDPLVQFLTVTRAGYCQQFAGAFGIMARSLGIPTRLVVGFIAGTPGAHHSYTITGADAHVWPQVYLGPGTGWVSVEPTPAADADTTAPAGVVEPTPPPSATSTTLVTGSTSPQGTRPAGGSSGAGTRGVGAHRTLRHHASSGSSWLWVLVALVIIGALGAGRYVLLRRRRSSAGDGSPNQRIVHAWEQAQRALKRRGLARRPAETPGEFAGRLARVEAQGSRRVGADAVAGLAGLVELACYTPTPCTQDQAVTAVNWANTVVDVTRRRASS